ncbi:RHS repeat-associated core domain-containing protein [Methylomonas methanica]|uniref:RHS repeat-associated core domain-containing protein n=1 Tax=Methylomonas methanica TaxID=421 RepID=UPI0018D3ABD5|nr:RHS repeat-associated core domain-containing protein [Methylomonas methanica]
MNITVRKLSLLPIIAGRRWYQIGMILLLGLTLNHRVQACSLQFTSPARGSTVSTAQVGVSGTGSGTANSGDQGQVTAYLNGVPFFSQSGTFTTLINLLGSGAASVTLQKGANTLSVSGSVNGCSASDSMVVYYQPAPPIEQKNAGEPEICNGTNPVNDATGNKFQQELDYQGGGRFPLQFIRYYNSAYSDVHALGKSWRHNYERELYFNSAKTEAYIIRPSGQAYRFSKSGSTWVSDADITDRFSASTDTGGSITGWHLYISEDNSFEYYDNNGRLITLVDLGGMSQDLSYDEGGRLSGVTDRTSQRRLSFSYDSKNRLASVTDPNGNGYTYSYDSVGRLMQVTPPVAVPGNPGRQYLYNEQDYTSNTNLPYALTGILDENGSRYASYRYDAQGRGIGTEHANGSDLHQLAYNADGSTTITDALGQPRTFLHQTILGFKHNVGQSQPAGSGCAASASHITYDANGNVASRTDFNGNLSCYAYDLNRNLETVRVEGLPAGAACPSDLASYTPPGTDSIRKIATQWHTDYRLPIQIDEAGRRTTFGYDSHGNLLSKTLTDTASGQSRTWSYSYNNLGQILTADGPRTDVNDVTTYTYYADSSADHKPGDLATIVNALGHVTTFTQYDANGRLLSLTDPNGLVISFAYDPRGRLIHKTVDGNTTVYDYDPVGNLIKLTRPTGVYHNFTYDAAHRLTDITDALGGKIHYTLDTMGNRIQEDILDANGTVVKTHSRVYDALNRLAQDIGGYNQTTQYTYDANGNLTQVTDAAGHSNQQQYDSLDRLIRSTDALNGQTDYDYDTLDRLVQVTDANNHSTAYSYNGLGDLLQLNSPNAGVTQYAYDSAGNLAQKTDARGQPVAYQHDALNRLTLQDYADNALDTLYLYDSAVTTHNSIGRLSSITDGSSETLYAHDRRGNLSSQQIQLDGRTYTTAYAYNADDALVHTQYPTGRQLDIAYDANGRATSLSTNGVNGTQTLADNIEYAPFGPQTRLSLSNGLTQSQQLNLDYLPLERTQGQTLVHGYRYDLTDNIIGIRDVNNAANDKTYAYDALSRLSHALGATQTDYTLDAVGNRTAITRNNQTDSYVYNLANDQLQSTPQRNYSYDAVGNVTADGHYQYHYNDHNRLSAVSNSGGNVAEYTYNAFGERLKKTTPSATTHYHYNQEGQLIAETGINGNPIKEYLYLNNRLIALATPAPDQDGDGVIDKHDNCRTIANPDQRDTDNDGFGNRCDADFNNNGIVDPSDFSLLKSRLGSQDPNLDINGNGIVDPTDFSILKSLLGRQPGPGADMNAAADASIYFAHTDHLGTPTVLTDSGQNIVWQADYEPFGKARITTQTVTNNIRFPGQYYDQETGLHYNMQRYYDPAIGRYRQSDPIGLSGGINTYSYVSNNPLNYTDSSGLIIDTLADIGFIAYDLYKLATDGACERNSNLTALGLDFVGAITPGVTGLGTASRVAKSGAESARQAADLSRHLGYTEKYGQAGVKELENGRIRYYGELQTANKAGEMAGRRYVHEFDPATGGSRGWHETLDYSGNVRQVRPELNNGSKQHYQFDRNGNYTGSW